LFLGEDKRWDTVEEVERATTGEIPAAPDRRHSRPGEIPLPPPPPPPVGQQRQQQQQQQQGLSKRIAQGLKEAFGKKKKSDKKDDDEVSEASSPYSPGVC